MNVGHEKSVMKPPRKRRWLLWVIIILLLLIVIAYFAIGGYAVSDITKIGEHPAFTKTPGSYGLEYQTVRFSARGDDTEIAAWYIPNSDAERVMILVHGRDANKRDAVFGTYSKFAADLHQAGYAILMIDLRGHGESEGERYSFGVYERRDVLGAVDWLRDHGFQEGGIGVHGMSMGTASVIGAAFEEPAIEILILESAFANLYPLIQERWEEESGLPNFFLPGVFIMNRILYGYGLRDIRPVDELAMVAPRPVLIIHCTTDEMIPLAQAYQLAEALPYTEMYLFDACEHANIYRDYAEEYTSVVTKYLRDNWE